MVEMDTSHRLKLINRSILFIFIVFFLFSFNVSFATSNNNNNNNPFSPTSSLIRYWNKHISNELPKPTFLLSKASPLSAVDAAFYARLAAGKALADHLSSFCSAANLFCGFDLSEEIDKRAHSDADFSSYTNKGFANYGSGRLGGADVFKGYSDGINFASGAFVRYSRSSTGHREDFANYSPDANVAAGNFTSYAAGATGGAGDFKTYMPRVNVPDLRFSSYDSSGNNHKLTFKSYVDDTNSGNQAFVSYAKNGNGVPADFNSYGDTSNVIGSAFTGYGELGNAANDSFTAYSSNANNPTNNFKNYGNGGNSGVHSFESYRDTANAGRDTFQSYDRDSNTGKTSFLNYGKSFNEGLDTFKEYAKGGRNPNVGFKVYGFNNSFKEYAQKGITFAGYTKKTSKIVSGKISEPKFFRENMLKEGSTMKMPDIKDKMPARSFLPRPISSKLPFSSKEMSELKRVFHARDNSTMERVIINALGECERVPSRGETKRCVGSVEDMIDFAAATLGRDITVRTTENRAGSRREVVIGKVNGVNGGRVTKSVSCHQSLYPYLLYYCHSVPKVRVYEADILDVETKTKINRGVAICHLDTSAWSPGHLAFVTLGYGPGQIEVCHWIFENDMTWTTADR
ncbi:polygalacturonase 1 beta-like protein 3 [Ipomoea triloba]|uniref:polygalacturonase 1 beta-like protein 3 n=1 Tax=Ipomoea triloba TaxID=35885 RepID=UPI00125D68BA|nr:polygalacturonase 1 beta-like protein 3 [Ipomoea triloba]